MDITLSESPEKKHGSRAGRPNYPRELRDRLAAAACEPGVSVARLARENGINANMLYTWRRRYLAEQQAPSTSLLPVVLLSDALTQVVASSSGVPRVASRRNVTRRIVVVSLSFFFSFVVCRARSARPPLTFNFSAAHTSTGVSADLRKLPSTISFTRSARHALTRRCSVRSCALLA